MEPSNSKDCVSLSRTERDALLGAMTPGDWGRANSLARMAAAGLADMTPDDVLQEALTKLLEGVRTWRRDVSPLVTLKLAMHSIASNALKKAKNAPIEAFLTVSNGDEEVPEGSPPPVQALYELTPADAVESMEQLAWIERLIAGDSDAELVLLAWATGFSGSEACEETGLDAKQFDAARNRLMRKLKPVAAVRETT